MDKWWRVLIVQDGKMVFYTVKAKDLPAAVNMAMVLQECGAECVMKAKPRKMSPGFRRLVEKFPDRDLFKGEVENED